VHHGHACNMHLQHSHNEATLVRHALHKIGCVAAHSCSTHSISHPLPCRRSSHTMQCKHSRHTHTACLPTICCALHSVLLLLPLACRLCCKPVHPLLCCLNPRLNHPLGHHRPVVRHPASTQASNNPPESDNHFWQRPLQTLLQSQRPGKSCATHACRPAVLSCTECAVLCCAAHTLRTTPLPHMCPALRMIR
jgi:hypothetical protein